MAAQPHFDTFTEGLGFYGVNSVFLAEYFCRRQSVENGFYRHTGISEPYRLKLAAVHELYPFAELAVVQEIGVRFSDDRICRLHAFYTIYAIDGRVYVARVFKTAFPFYVVRKCCQIKIVFREHDRRGHYPAVNGFAFPEPAVIYLNDPLLLYRRADIPEYINEFYSVMRFAIMIFLVAYHGGDLAAAVHALVSESGCGQSELEQAMKVLEEKHLEAEEYDLYDPYG